MTSQEISESIRKEIERLQKVVSILTGKEVTNPRTFSAESRKRMALAQKKRWAKIKRAA